MSAIFWWNYGEIIYSNAAFSFSARNVKIHEALLAMDPEVEALLAPLRALVKEQVLIIK